MDDADLEASPLFCVLSPAETRALAASAARRTFGPGKRLFSEGARNVAIHVIVRGVVCLSRSSRKGHTLTLRRVSVGSVLGQMSALDGSGHSVSAQAEDRVEVLSIPRPRYLAALKRHPEAALALARILGDLVRRLSGELESMKYSTIETRLIAKLIDRARHRREIFVTHAALAAEVGATRENVSRILGRLEKKRIIALNRGRIEILNHRTLNAVGADDSTLL
jgi:CRP-like cAMP-binding protein